MGIFAANRGCLLYASHATPVTWLQLSSRGLGPPLGYPPSQFLHLCHHAQYALEEPGLWQPLLFFVFTLLKRHMAQPKRLVHYFPNSMCPQQGFTLRDDLSLPDQTQGTVYLEHRSSWLEHVARPPADGAIQGKKGQKTDRARVTLSLVQSQGHLILWSRTLRSWATIGLVPS